MMSPVVALILANLVWGAGSPIFKFALTNVPPFTLAFMRFFFAAIILIPWVLKSKKSPTIRDFLEIVAGAFFGVTINISFFFLGLQKASSINNTIINSAGPMFLFLIAVLLFHEKMIKKVFTGMLFSLAGVLIIILSPFFTTHPLISVGAIEGNIFFVIACIGAVLQPVILRNVLRRVNYNVVSFWTFFFGALSFFPFMLKEFQTWSLSEVNSAGLFGILYGIFGSTLVGYGLFNYGIAKIKLQEIGVFTYLEPVGAVVVAFFLTHEYLTFFDIIGGIFIILGIFISERKLYQHKLHKTS